MNKIKILAVIIIVILGILVWLLYNDPFSKSGWVTFDGVEEFTITNMHVPSYSDYTTQITEMQHDSVNVRIQEFEDITEQEYVVFLAKRAAILEAMFKPRLPPYPEFLTNETGCDQSLIPKKLIHGDKTVYTLYAGERFGYGICNSDLAVYRASTTYLYCAKQETVYIVDFFSSRGESVEVLKERAISVVCE